MHGEDAYWKRENQRTDEKQEKQKAKKARERPVGFVHGL
jgi:hypothetical protein